MTLELALALGVSCLITAIIGVFRGDHTEGMTSLALAFVCGFYICLQLL